MSSHREAPEISKDPVADSTDLYAFVSPDQPNTVTLIANYIPLQEPSGGPNFYEFGDDVLYEIHVDNNGDGMADVTYQFRFETKLTTPARGIRTERQKRDRLRMEFLRRFQVGGGRFAPRLIGSSTRRQWQDCARRVPIV